MAKNQNPGTLPDKDKDRDDEEVIDLTEVMGDADDEDIIDLNNVLDSPDATSVEPEPLEEEAIPLLDVVPTDGASELSGNAEENVIDLMDPAPAMSSSPAEPYIDRNVSSPDRRKEPDLTETITLDEKQLENALVRAVEKVYGEKIEQLLVQTIENTIKQEIDTIRRSLMKE
jgi:hypothetical protein